MRQVSAGAAVDMKLLWFWVLWLHTHGTFEKCIFDDVQPLVRVVAPPLHLSPSPPHIMAASSETPARAQTGATPTSPKSAPPAGNVLSKRSSCKRTSRNSAPPTQQFMHSDLPALLPIRIRTWIPQESPVLSQMENERLEAAVKEAVSTVAHLLSVIRVSGPLLLSRDINKYCRFIWRNASTANYNRCGRANELYRAETCLDIIIPDDHLRGCAVYPSPDSPALTVLRPEGAGIPDTDFVLYLHTQSTDKCGAEPSVRAYAAHCQTDAQGRPLAGVLVMCRDRLRGERYSHQSTVQTVIHELFHTLGFSKELFSTWKDCSNSPHIGVGCSPRGQVTNTDEAGQVRIYTQSVIRALQTHLRSSDPQLGGPLENQDGVGSGFSSHWEARVLQGSIMAAALADPVMVRIDPVTLAALQDTGWYSVNYNNMQALEWGEGQGALFGSLSTCHDNSSSYFCTGSGSGCHYLHLHKGECQGDEYLEGCRIYKPLMNASECWKEENEKMTGREEWSGEIHRSDSRCFFSNLSRENSSSSLSGSVVGRCYRHRCTGLNQYQIQVSGSAWVDCPSGTAIQVSGYRGSVFCPDKRLCRLSYTAPSINSQDPLPNAPPTPGSSPNENGQISANQQLTPFPGLTFDPGTACTKSVSRAPPTVASVLGGVAAASLLVVLALASRRQLSFRARVHAAAGDPAPEAPPPLQLQPAFCLTKQC
ncbi:leishmanolysin-like peptidase 2 [Megalops cyprinoides]|uniref:leishmanolysin-like peptidase 2 n=1 Tax=Megalops cyprinoides TaxID=118141 RepID=UPI001863DE74|nr:leishmanolysin-like peptidase 2 [Megalops cyprinoides]